MAQRAIREYDAKRHLSKYWEKYFPQFSYAFESALICKKNDLNAENQEQDWIHSKSLVVKPDMLFGKRGLNGLVYLKKETIGDVKLKDALNWIEEKQKESTTLLCKTKGVLDTFIVEPFIPHSSNEEYYISCTTEATEDILYLSAHGGVNIEKNWDSVIEIRIPLDATSEDIEKLISNNIPLEMTQKEQVKDFAFGFYNFFKDLHFAYLELNPFVLKDSEIFILDVVARIDDAASYMMHGVWDKLEFPQVFGAKEPTAIEKEIQSLDEKSGASLKLTILNPKGRVWTLVAGGGASVVYADEIANLWGVHELANYGEYSGNPSKDETFVYTKGVLELMCQEPAEDGQNKILIIGGAIANFTDVAKTFDGIIQAFNEMHEKMRAVKVQIYVRRGGPNYEIGLKNIESAATRLGLPIKVYGPETHLTDIVRLAHAMQHEGVTV